MNCEDIKKQIIEKITFLNDNFGVAGQNEACQSTIMEMDQLVQAYQRKRREGEV